MQALVIQSAQRQLHRGEASVAEIVFNLGRGEIAFDN
jgi:hypothetical protein